MRVLCHDTIPTHTCCVSHCMPTALYRRLENIDLTCITAPAWPNRWTSLAVFTRQKILPRNLRLWNIKKKKLRNIKSIKHYSTHNLSKRTDKNNFFFTQTKSEIIDLYTFHKNIITSRLCRSISYFCIILL